MLETTEPVSIVWDIDQSAETSENVYPGLVSGPLQAAHSGILYALGRLDYTIVNISEIWIIMAFNLMLLNAMSKQNVTTHAFAGEAKHEGCEQRLTCYRSLTSADKGTPRWQAIASQRHEKGIAS